MSETLWSNRGENPYEFLSWLYDHPGASVPDFDHAQRSAYYDIPAEVRPTTPFYDEFDWDWGLDELRHKGLIAGDGWEDLHPTQDRNERFYPTVPDCTVELTAAGRTLVEDRRVARIADLGLS